MANPQRPNILFIIVDQMTGRALHPDSQCQTPHLDTLAESGMRFQRCTTPNAICSPARASLMTGLYPSTHGMWDCTHTQRAEWLDVPASRFTYFSQRLADAGYRNGYFGKWHVEQSGQLEDFGWHEYDHTIGLAPLQASGDDAANKVVLKTPGYRDFLVAGVHIGEVPHHPAFEQGIDFIRRQANKEHSFCCVVSALEPHDPYIAPLPFFEQYDLGEIVLSPTLRDYLRGKPEILRRMQRVWTDFNDDGWRVIMAAYWATISYLDAQVGRILAALQESGQADNTIVVFTSDHGEMLGGHGLLTKGVATAYEEVYNIPLVMRVPDMRAGQTASQAAAQARVSLVDLAPTLLDLCDVEPLPVQQGRSLRPLLDGTADLAEWQDAYAEFFGQRFVYSQRITWQGPWKYIFSPGGIDELYDLDTDPYEQVNLVDDPVHRDRLVEMTQHMWRKMESIGDNSLYNSHYPTLRTAPIGPLST